MKTNRLTSAVLFLLAGAGLPAARGQTNATWLGGTGNWAVGNWNFGGVPNNGTPPGSRYDVFIDDGNPAGSNVTLSGPILIDDLFISPGDTLQISNAAQLTLAATGDGTLSNGGQLNFNSTGNVTELRIARNVTLAGSGTVVLSNSFQNRFTGVAGTERLTNAGNTIRGAGQIGLNVIGFTNGGVVIADQSSGIVIDPNATGAINTGVLRAEAPAVLTLHDGSFTNTGGIIQATTGSRVDLSNAVVTGGSLQTLLSGVIRSTTAGGGTRLTDLANAGAYEQLNDADTTLAGTITNTGTIALKAAGNSTDLVASGDVILTGGGAVTFTNSVNNRIYGTGANRFTNVNNTITGAGQIGVNQTLLTNQALIDANVSNPLTIDPLGSSGSASAGMTNSNTLRASTGGTLTLVDGKFDNTGGLIHAAGVLNVTSAAVLGGNVDVTGTGQINFAAGSITDGVLTNSAAGILRVVTAGTLGGTVTNPAGGQIILNNDGDLQLRGAAGDSYSNAGSIALNSTGNSTDLTIGGDVTLSGGGAVTLSSNFNNRIFGATGTQRLTNADQTISGGGQLGLNSMALTNQSLIVANQPAGLLIDPSAGGVINTGTLRADAGAVLTLTGGNFTNTGGVIEALTGARVDLSGATISGGTLQTSGTGLIRNVATGVLANVTLAAAYEHPNDADATLIGTITNTGIIALKAAGNSTDLVASGDVLLTGGGAVTFTNSVNNRIYGTGTNRFTNVNSTISGAGQIGVNQTLLTNQALIDANVSNSLTIDPTGSSGSASAGMINTGTLRASTGGSLTLVDGKFDNTGGLIRAAGVLNVNSSAVLGGTVDMAGAGQVNLSVGSITDGIFNISPTGVIRVVSAGNSTLGGTVTNPAGGQIILNNDGDLRLRGAAGDTYFNAGSIALNSTGNSTDLTIGGNVTLSGGGTVTFSNNNNNRIFGATGTERFTNADHTISGAGQIGVNVMNFTNDGTVIANQANALTIDPALGGMTNNGTLRALAGSTLIVTDGLTNFAGTTLTGGIYEVFGTAGTVGNLRLTNANIVTNAASIVLDGPNSNLLRHDTGASALANFAINSGALTLRNGRVLTTPGAYTQTAGSTTLNGGALTSAVGSVVISAGTLRGNGSVNASVQNSGDIAPGLSTGELTINGNLTLTGTSRVQMEILGTAPVTGHDRLAVAGTVTLAGALEITVTPSLPAGTVLVILPAGSGAITGTFAGKPEGASFTAGGQTFSITYAGGDGNDVALTVVTGASSNPASIVSFSLAPGTGAEAGLEVVDLAATGDPGASYDLEASTDLVIWTVAQTRIAAAGTGALSFHLAQSPAIVRRYYRIKR